MLKVWFQIYFRFSLKSSLMLIPALYNALRWILLPGLGASRPPHPPMAAGGGLYSLGKGQVP